jgi:hypothetical protein
VPGLVRGNHLIDDPGDARHALGDRDECLALRRRSDKAPEMNLAVCDNDIAAAEVRPGLRLQTRQQFLADRAALVQFLARLKAG